MTRPLLVIEWRLLCAPVLPRVAEGHPGRGIKGGWRSVGFAKVFSSAGGHLRPDLALSGLGKVHPGSGLAASRVAPIDEVSVALVAVSGVAPLGAPQ